MSTIYISAILDKVMEVTGDAVPSQTSKTQMVSWLCEGERVIVKKKPDAYMKTTAAQMVEGTMQTLASDGAMFAKPVCNMGTDGTTPGNVVHLVNENFINKSTPDWHSEEGEATIKSVIFNIDDPKIFYVSPPQPSSDQGFLRYRYFAIPPEITIVAGNYDVVFNLGNEYEPDLVNYILARIYSKDGGQLISAGALNRAKMYNGLFSGDLQYQEAVEDAKDPNRKA